MTKDEMKIASELLEMASERFSRECCNDMFIDNTDDNWAMIVRMCEDNVGKPWDQLSEDDRQVRAPIDKKQRTYNWWVASYLSKQLAKLAEDK